MATTKDSKNFNDEQTELLNIIIDKGNKDKNYEILVNDIIANCSNKNEKSVRSKLTTIKMKKYIHYNKKLDDKHLASVQLQDDDEKSTFELVNQLLNQDKQD